MLHNEYMPVVLACSLLLLVAMLVVFACLARPFCSEIAISELYSPNSAGERASRRKRPTQTGPMASQHRGPTYEELWPGGEWDELKILLIWLGLVCGVASIICLLHGGLPVWEIWRAPQKMSCSVADLSSIQQEGFHSFWCQDGRLGMEHQQSSLRLKTRRPSVVEAYHLAPVYHGDSSRDLAAPVAWAVSKNLHMHSLTGGLHGIVLDTGEDCVDTLRCLSSEDAELFGDLAQGLAKKLSLKLQETLPLVALTNPSNPFGQNYLLFMAGGLYLVTLCSLIALQCQMCHEEPPIDSAGHMELGYSYEPIRTEPRE